MKRQLLLLFVAFSGSVFLSGCSEKSHPDPGFFVPVTTGESHISFSNNLEPNPALGILQYI